MMLLAFTLARNNLYLVFDLRPLTQANVGAITLARSKALKQFFLFPDTIRNLRLHYYRRLLMRHQDEDPRRLVHEVWRMKMYNAHRLCRDSLAQLKRLVLAQPRGYHREYSDVDAARNRNLKKGEIVYQFRNSIGYAGYSDRCLCRFEPAY